MKISLFFSVLIASGLVILSSAQDSDPPVVSNINPPAEEYLGSVTQHIFSAEVTDASSLNFVRFEFERPDGTRTGQEEASEQSSGVYVLSKSFDDTGLDDGIWRWRIRARDSSGNTRRTPFVSFSIAHGAQTVVMLARNDIEDLIADNVSLAAKFVRMGFHDCVGGCDGCIDMQNGDNAGLDIPIQAIESVVTKFESATIGVTRADIWAMATLAAADVSLPNGDRGRFPFTHFGRTNCENLGLSCPNGCDSTNGPYRGMPSSELLTHELLTFFDNEFGFTTQEVVALMGAHTLGTLSQQNSGFNGQWVNNNNRLSNTYYSALVGGTSPDDPEEVLMDGPGWAQEAVDNSAFPVPDRTQWVHVNPGGAETVMINSDMSLVRDVTGHLDALTGVATCRFKCNGRNCNNQNLLPVCPAAQQTLTLMATYKHNNTLFIDDFEAVIGKMMVAGYSAPPCADAVCPLGVAAPSRRLRKRNQE